ncbi:basic proline-rich protein-like [Panthera tigris]|uniref:basic proline-rich protein-like n=1 Tax=Panthera tigris TaxID=9694 RepID=UPI001C6F84C5|nr:basic proline-rich protein-like [Panthera tigris]
MGVAWGRRERIKGRAAGPKALRTCREVSVDGAPQEPRPPPTSPRPRPPFRPAAARLGSAAQGLAGRLGSAAAAPVTATPRLRPGPAPPPPPPLGPGAAATHPHFPCRRGCPAWSCVRHGSRLLLLLLLLLPCPPAGPPPAAAAAAAACTTQPPPSRLSSSAPRPPGLTGSGYRGGEAGGGGPERTAIGVRGGGAGKPSPPSPHKPEAREGPGNLPPGAATAPGSPPAPAGAPRAGACFYLKARGPFPWAPAPSPAPAHRLLLRVLEPPSPSGASEDPASRHFGPREEGVTFFRLGAPEQPPQDTLEERVLHLRPPLRCARTHHTTPRTSMETPPPRHPVKKTHPPPPPPQHPRRAVEQVRAGQEAPKTGHRLQRNVSWVLEPLCPRRPWPAAPESLRFSVFPLRKITTHLL